MTDEMLVEKVREIFPRVYRDWRDDCLNEQERNFIPWEGHDLADLLCVELERELARTALSAGVGR